MRLNWPSTNFRWLARAIFQNTKFRNMRRWACDVRSASGGITADASTLSWTTGARKNTTRKQRRLRGSCASSDGGRAFHGALVFAVLFLDAKVFGVKFGDVV